MLPLFYKTLQFLDSKTHADWGVAQGQSGFAFAAHTNVVPLAISELSYAIASYPVVLVQQQDAVAPALVALVGNGDNNNQFVQANGQWREGAYVPAWVRRYPFVLVNQEANSTEVALAFDPSAHALVGPEHAAKLWLEQQPSPVLTSILNFQREVALALSATAVAVQALVDAQVLEEATISFNKPDDAAAAAPQRLSGFMMVNEAKLQALDGAALEALSKANALGLAYAQMLSMRNVQYITPPV